MVAVISQTAKMADPVFTVVPFTLTFIVTGEPPTLSRSVPGETVRLLRLIDHPNRPPLYDLYVPEVGLDVSIISLSLRMAHDFDAAISAFPLASAMIKFFPNK